MYLKIFGIILSSILLILQLFSPTTLCFCMFLSKRTILSKEQFYFLQQLHQLNYSNIDTFININKQNQK